MARLIPWSEFEKEYASFFHKEMGAPAKSFRMANGALIIKEKLGITDRETVEQIKENPYLQYFIGMSSYSNETPFDASMLVHFRERISVSLVNKVNQEMVKRMLETTSAEPTEKKIEEKEISELATPAAQPTEKKIEEKETEKGQEISESAIPTADLPLTKKEGEPKNRGKLILDATCAPADISYPTDLGLLNQA